MHLFIMDVRDLSLVQILVSYSVFMMLVSVSQSVKKQTAQGIKIQRIKLKIIRNQIITFSFIYMSNNMKDGHQMPVKLLKNYCRGVHYQSCRMIAGELSEKKVFCWYFLKVLKTVFSLCYFRHVRQVLMCYSFS